MVRGLKETKFNKENEEHRAALEEVCEKNALFFLQQESNLWKLWNSLTDKQENIWKDWKDIGFQGKDPSTDFRGAGWLSLLQLIYFAKKYNSLCTRILYNCNTSVPK
jgi:hypothetical protein